MMQATNSMADISKNGHNFFFRETGLHSLIQNLEDMGFTVGHQKHNLINATSSVGYTAVHIPYYVWMTT